MKPRNEQRWINGDYRLTPEGNLAHKRWLNPDGSYKVGVELENEKMRVELEIMARRLLEFVKTYPSAPS